MTRVLSVSDTSTDFEGGVLRDRITAAGDDAAFRFTSVVLPPSGATPAAVRALARQNARAEFDVIHAIGPSALLAAAAIGCQPIVYSPPPDEPARRAARLKLVSAVRQVRVVCNSPAALRELSAAGVRGECLTLLPPPLPGATSATGPIDRAALGLAREDRVLLAIGESTRRARHEQVIHAAVILRFLDPRYRLLIWGRGPAAGRVRRFDAALRQPGFCVFAEPALGREVDWRDLVGLADLAVNASAGAGSVLAASICARSGLSAVDLVHPRATARRVHAIFDGSEPAPPMAHPHASTIEDWKTLYRDVCVGRRASDVKAAAVAV